MSRTRLSLAHVVPLRAVGGVERSYGEFIAYGGFSEPVEHHTVALGRGIPPLLEPGIRRASRSLHLGHFDDGRHLPFSPTEIREARLEGILARLHPDLALFWNKPSGVRPERLPPDLPVVYWERGRSWKETDETAAPSFLRHVDAILCNSRAARRFVQLRWQLDDAVPLHVCPNAVRPGSGLRQAAGKRLAPGAPLRLGFAGRLVAVKGAPLALHAVRDLVSSGVDCRLEVAGEGPDRSALEVLARSLGLAEQVRFVGLVDDMGSFYRDIDCLLCPSLREPFGLVAAEALAHGCAVVATAVDGLAEVLEDTPAGISVSPDLPLSRYRDFGGDPREVPPRVYHPREDRLGEPRLPAPRALAAAVRSLTEPRERFAERSAEAARRAERRFSFSDHAERVFAILRSVREEAPRRRAAESD